MGSLNSSSGHCFYRRYQNLEPHQLPCISHCPRPCRQEGTMMLGIGHQFPGRHRGMTGGAVSPKMSLYRIFAGTSRWPSAKSNVSLTGNGGRGLANVPSAPHRPLRYWSGEGCSLTSLLYAGLDPNWLRARPVVLKLEQEPEVGISLSPHPRGSVTKVNIL